jgi:hypothetical protein
MKLYKQAYDQARRLVNQGRVVRDDRDAWSEHQPRAAEENAFIRAHGFEEYGRWHLGIDEEAPQETKKRYKFPYGDFRKVHRCAVISAESRAGQYKYLDIEAAVARLHELIEGGTITHRKGTSRKLRQPAASRRAAASRRGG